MENEQNLVCAVTVACHEMLSVDEWIAYHSLIGIDHFFIYDTSPIWQLRSFLQVHGPTVTVISWNNKAHKDHRVAAYEDAIHNHIRRYKWATFIDIDEFIVLRKHPDLRAFLRDFDRRDQISIHQYLFGHNGFFEDPPGPLTTTLIRRRKKPTKKYRSIVRTESISQIIDPCACELQSGRIHVDTNNHAFTKKLYPGKMEIAQINRYACRSFTHWMERRPVVESAVDEPTNERSKHDRESRLRKFVRKIARDWNESFDDFMVQYGDRIASRLHELRAARSPSHSSVSRSKSMHDETSFVIYTAITQGYDELIEQPQDKQHNIEQIAFVEGSPKARAWRIRPVEPCTTDPNRNAKWYKILSHLHFPQKRYSLWIDGCVMLNVSPLELLDTYLQDFDMVVHRHPDRDCIYSEALVCQRKNLDDPLIISEQMSRYRREAFPSHAGMHENAVILRRHNDRVKAFNALWWEEIARGSRRDQLSSPYVALRVGLKVGYFPGSMRQSRPDYNGLFTRVPHLVARPRKYLP